MAHGVAGQDAHLDAASVGHRDLAQARSQVLGCHVGTLRGVQLLAGRDDRSTRVGGRRPAVDGLIRRRGGGGLRWGRRFRCSDGRSGTTS